MNANARKISFVLDFFCMMFGSLRQSIFIHCKRERRFKITHRVSEAFSGCEANMQTGLSFTAQASSEERQS